MRIVTLDTCQLLLFAQLRIPVAVCAAMNAQTEVAIVKLMTGCTELIRIGPRDLAPIMRDIGVTVRRMMTIEAKQIKPVIHYDVTVCACQGLTTLTRR